MKQIVMNTALTETGYCCSCDLLTGWVVTGSRDFAQFKEEVMESIAFYVDRAKADGEEYPSVLDSDYEIVYKFGVRSPEEELMGETV